ncbi:MAG: universal stress protein [Nitrospirota bacterium]
MFRKMLVAFDGSEQSNKAFDAALEMDVKCSNKSANILVLSVAQLPEPAELTLINEGSIIKGITEYYEEQFKALKERAEKKGVNISTEVVMGHPADMIVKYAEEKGCDMIIMGHRGRSKIANWLLGSVSRRVASYSPCTVTIVK